MPNHCQNTLGVLGKTEDVIEFINFITLDESTGSSDDKYKIFRSLSPMPIELENTTSLIAGEENKELIEKYGSDNWYNWANENWGTKWGDYSIDTSGIEHCNVTTYNILENGDPDYENPITKSNGESYIHFEYQTAWGPGSDFLKEQLSKQFPKLMFWLYYEEPGMCFAGEIKINKGEIVSDESWEYHYKYDSIADIDWDHYDYMKAEKAGEL